VDRCVGRRKSGANHPHRPLTCPYGGATAAWRTHIGHPPLVRRKAVGVLCFVRRLKIPVSNRRQEVPHRYKRHSGSC
jgi:hypothetical protein